MSEISIPDQRMIQLMEYAVKNELALNEGDYWEKISFTRTGLRNIRIGLQSFRVEHIKAACLVTGASADWVLGLDKEMFRVTKKKNGMELLREATAQLQFELKKKRSLSVLL